MNILISKKMCNFILLTQTNNIAQAAERVHMTASPSGKSIAAPERRIGYTLSTRKDNGISLNRAGQKLYQKLLPVCQRPSAIGDETHDSGRHSREAMISTDSTYPTVIFNQLVNLGDKHGGVTAQPAKLSENDVIDNLLGHQLDLIISLQHISARTQELENLTINELPPLRLNFLVSRHCEGRQEQGLLQGLSWLQMRFRNRTNFEAVIDANMRPCGVNPTIIYRLYSFMTKISTVERGHFLTMIPYFARRLVNPATLRYFDISHRPMYMQGYLCSIRNHRYAATMLRHITEDHDGTSH